MIIFWFGYDTHVYQAEDLHDVIISKIIIIYSVDSMWPDAKSLEDHKTQITTEHSLLPADSIETCVYGFCFTS